ncbi:MAG TPA: hypothetical protein PLZ84_05375 [Clostridia bacterium]|nr:hypothetical protein [Clostridia bacterium]
MMNVKEMFGLNLPEQVPHLGFEEPYIVGNGITMSGGTINGIWDFSVGYSYGYASNIIKRERLKVYIDGNPYTLQGKMHRARGTGVFYSVQQFPKAAACLVDFAPPNRPFSARLIAVKNTSSKSIAVYPYAEVKYDSELNKVEVYKNALHIVHVKKSWLTLSFGGCDTIIRDYTGFLKSDVMVLGNEITLAPGEVKYFTLYHDARMSEKPLCEQQFPDRKDEDGTAYLRECINEWNDWLAAGFDISSIPDQRCRDVVESTIVIERMLQGEDGGVQATPRVYGGCYVRDSFSAMKGMLAAEHYAEVKKFLQFQYKVYKKRTGRGEFGVPTASAIGDYGEGVFFGFGDEENWSCESPGLVVVLARDYYNATGDAELLASIEELLNFCIDVQLAHAEKHGWKMYFNGDETESSGCGITMKESVFVGDKWWSMTSLLICLTSTAFMVEYLKLKGEGDSGKCKEYERKIAMLAASYEENFWNENLCIYHWFRKPDGSWPQTLIPNYHIAPLYFKAPVNREHTVQSAKNMIQFLNRETGYIPNQVWGENHDFCGHNMGYLLYMAATLGLPEADDVYKSLVYGTSVSAFGMWCEAYYDDGTPYQYPTTFDNRIHNFRCFESGTNLEAIIRYWKSKQGKR